MATPKQEKQNKGGRPALYKDVSVLEAKIKEYLEIKCKDEIITGIDGKPVCDLKGRLVIKYHPPTISGLALHLGFLNRASIYDYIERDDEFSNTIKRAIALIEDYAEKQLFVGNSTGAIFWLKNRGWSDKQEIEQTNIDKTPFEVKIVK